MARNPVVGRQGPAHHAAVIPAEAEASTLAVTQIRSGIGHSDTMRRTLRALGLRHHQQTVVKSDTPSLRGQLKQVRHLVEVTAVDVAPVSAGAEA